MGKRQEKVRERLRRAQEDVALVRVYRGDDLDVIDGYVLALGREWLLLAALDAAIVLDGQTALRLSDVRRVGRPRRGDMVQQALKLREQWPPAASQEAFDLDSGSGLLASLMSEKVITVHPEHDDPDICFVGAPVTIDGDCLWLLEVTPRGVWLSRPTQHRVEDVTRVDLGGRYEEALVSVAGEPDRPA